MLELRKLEAATGLSIVYTLKVPGRFDRFATACLDPMRPGIERNKLKEELNAHRGFPERPDEGP